MTVARHLRFALACVFTIATGCTTVAQYRGSLGSFRDGYATAAPALGQVYIHLNDFEREVYLARASCDPTMAVAERGPDALGTPLGQDRFAAEYIQARVDAIALLGGYADRLASLASEDGETHFATTGTRLADHLATLAERFTAFVDTSAHAYVEPVQIVTNIITATIVGARQDAGVRHAILAGADPVRAVLNLLEGDLGEAIRISQASGYDVMLGQCMDYYNGHRAAWTQPERRSVLRQLAGIARRRAHFRAANPVELVQAMRDAHEALIHFASTPTRDPGDLEALGNAMTLFSHRVQETTASIRQLAADETDDHDATDSSH